MSRELEKRYPFQKSNMTSSKAEERGMNYIAGYVDWSCMRRELVSYHYTGVLFYYTYYTGTTHRCFRYSYEIARPCLCGTEQ